MKFASKYRSIVKLDDMDWCSFMDKINSIKNRYAKAFLKGFKDTMLRLFDPCPFIGPVNLINIKPPDKILSILPAGDFINKYTIVDSIQKCKVIVHSCFTIEK